MMILYLTEINVLLYNVYAIKSPRQKYKYKVLKWLQNLILIILLKKIPSSTKIQQEVNEPTCSGRRVTCRQIRCSIYRFSKCPVLSALFACFSAHLCLVQPPKVAITLSFPARLSLNCDTRIYGPIITNWCRASRS